jgi:hypothetical protein
MFLVISSIAFMLVGLAILWLHAKLMGPSGDMAAREVASSAAFRISAIYSLVLGLIFSGVSFQFTEAQRNLQQQAVQIGKIHSLLGLYESEQVQPVRQQLKTLLQHSIQEFESEQFASAQATPSAQSFLDLRKLTLQLPDESQKQRALKHEVLTQVSQLGDIRLNRFVFRWGNATPGFWIFYIVGFLLVVFCFGAYSASAKRDVYVALFCVFVGMTAYFIYGLSSPFTAPIKIDDLAFQELAARLRE